MMSRIKPILAATAISIAAISPALAQSNAPSATPSPSMQSPSVMPRTAGEAFLHQQNRGDWRASRIIGASVVSGDNTKIGSVNDVVIDSSGAPTAIVVGVGGFLGVGEKEVAIPFKSANIIPTATGDKIESIAVTYTKDDLQNAPAYKWYTAATPAVPPKSDRRSDLRR